MKQNAKIYVLAGIITSWVIASLFIYLGYNLNVFEGDRNQAVGFALIVAALSLAWGIGLAAKTRHLSQNIDGTAPAEGTPLDLTLRYISNTSEQLLLFSLAVISFGLVANESLVIRLLPVLGIWFVIARALFYIGYRYNPLARSIGFAGTFHPTLILLFYSLYCCLT